MGRVNVTSPICVEPLGSNNGKLRQLLLLLAVTEQTNFMLMYDASCVKLTWLVLGGDPVARSHRVEQFTAL